VLERRYLLKDGEGRVVETPAGLFRRVASAVAKAEEGYEVSRRAEVEERFYDMLASLRFLPNSPCLMNAGTTLGQLAACFTLPVEDSMESIFETLKHMALIHQSGGGTGFSFSRLRPKGDIVGSTMGIASGPTSFMSIFDKATDVIRQGGRRRGANMGILRADHPDVLDFITCKRDRTSFRNFNISVAAPDDFMTRVRRNASYALVNPRTKTVLRSVPAATIWRYLITNAWEVGDPGVIFIDEINRRQPTPELGLIESTNPCGEMPLLPYESCNLASINLSKFVVKREVNWPALAETVTWGVRFLDNVIDVTRFPLPEIAELTKGNRKIGLGVMGFADALILLGVPYDDPKARRLAERFMAFVTQTARQASAALAEERGSFPNIRKSVWPKRGCRALRNATVTTVAPTGTISIIAGCSSGIEPLFAVSFWRNIMEGTELFEMHPLFRQALEERGLASEALLAEVARVGSLASIRGIPSDLKELFLTSGDVRPEAHVRMQASFQKYTDNAVNKTMNLPKAATVEDVANIYQLAHRLKCKGITVYRAGTRTGEPLSWGAARRPGQPQEHVIQVTLEESGPCPPERCFY
jgi:ribonucleoside-diphosphate reductase alpha chain